MLYVDLSLFHSYHPFGGLPAKSTCVAVSLVAYPDLDRKATDLTYPKQVGNEFSSVEALWSQFENVMAKEPEEEGNKTDAGAEGEGDDTPKKED